MPRVKLTGDFGDAIKVTRIGDRSPFARKIRGPATFEFCNTIPRESGRQSHAPPSLCHKPSRDIQVLTKKRDRLTVVANPIRFDTTVSPDVFRMR